MQFPSSRHSQNPCKKFLQETCLVPAKRSQSRVVEAMAEQRDEWEEKFVDAFVVKTKRSRYKSLLRNSKKQAKILGRLNHNTDLEFSKSIELAGARAFSEPLLRTLSTYKIDTHCWVLSDNRDLDSRFLPVCEAVERTALGYSGTILICPPRSIVVYRPESMDKCTYLFL